MTRAKAHVKLRSIGFAWLRQGSLFAVTNLAVTFFAVAFLALTFGVRDASAQSSIELMPAPPTVLIDSTLPEIDTAFGGPLKPRYGSYVIETYPSPANYSDIVTVQYYNHQPEITTLGIFDVNDREIKRLQNKEGTTAGLHTFKLATHGMASGLYFVRLTVYSETDKVLQVENSRFLVLH